MKRLAGPVLADSTPETVYTVAAGEAAEVTYVSLAQPDTGGVETVIRISIGADATGTRIFEFKVPAGVGFYGHWVSWPMVAAEILQLSSTVSDDIVRVVISGDRRII